MPASPELLWGIVRDAGWFLANCMAIKTTTKPNRKTKNRVFAFLVKSGQEQPETGFYERRDYLTPPE
jgi:hypothetical protein